MRKSALSAAGPWFVVAAIAALGAAVDGVPGLLIGAGAAALLIWQGRLIPFSSRWWGTSVRGRRQRIYLTALFSWAGHVAKADGRVSEPEIAATRGLMSEVGLDAPARRLAIRLFTHGKAPGFPRRVVARRLRRALAGDSERRQRFMELLLRVALADGALRGRQEHLVREIAAALQVPRDTLESMLRRRRARAEETAKSLRPRLGQAFGLLELSENATEAEIKRAYRRQISRHHPDRLEAQGLSPEKVRAGADRTRRVREAYEAIRRARGF
ncbi:MAG: co-chaperone DjlA [Ectothiorhodospiraceae bacterium]|jgi:DnaJ like chaperone protein